MPLVVESEAPGSWPRRSTVPVGTWSFSASLVSSTPKPPRNY
jgi:hypothetical protein